MRTSTKEQLIKKDTIVGYKITKFSDGIESDSFTIPIYDTRRDGRGLVDLMEKEVYIQRGSKFFKPSYSVLGYSYNASMKNQKP